MRANIEIKLDKSAIDSLQNAVTTASGLVAEEIYADVVESAVMPFDTGTMQGDQTYTSAERTSDGVLAFITTNAPQARRLYYNPQYNFQRGKNRNAGAYWLEAYKEGGEKENFADNKFSLIFPRVARL